MISREYLIRQLENIQSYKDIGFAVTIALQQLIEDIEFDIEKGQNEEFANTELCPDYCGRIVIYDKTHECSD